MNFLMSVEHKTCWVIFIVKVSRIPSESQYIGFQGGECSNITHCQILNYLLTVSHYV